MDSKNGLRSHEQECDQQWSEAKRLFEPAIWSQEAYAPFLDILPNILEHRMSYSQSAEAGWPENMGSHGTSDSHVADPPAQWERATTPDADSDDVIEPLMLDPSSVNELPSPPDTESCRTFDASALKPPDIEQSPSSASMTTAGSAARSSGDCSCMFAGVNTPKLPLPVYVHRIARYAGCSAVCFLYALSYMIHLDEACHAKISPKTVHRMLIASVVIAVKFVEDRCFTNAHYAKVGGIPVQQLNRMELQICCLLDFRLDFPGSDPASTLAKVSQALGTSFVL